MILLKYLKIYLTDTDLKIILLGYQNYYIKCSNWIVKIAKFFAALFIMLKIIKLFRWFTKIIFKSISTLNKNLLNFNRYFFE